MLQSGGSSSLGASLGNLVGNTVKKTSKSTSASRAAQSVGRSVSGGSSRRGTSSGSRSSGYSSSNSGGGSSRSTGGSIGRLTTSVAKAAPKVPSLAAYLGTDSSYQQALSGGKRSLADFLSELGRRRGEATTQYNTTLGSMERDRAQQLEDLRNEYASRGLIQSGLYGEEQGKFQQQFQEQQTALQQQQAALMADLLSQETNYRRENDLTLQDAKNQALQRRAARYNIGG